MSTRKVVLVGRYAEAQIWKEGHRTVPDDQVAIAANPIRFGGLDPSDCWIIMLPSFWDLDHHQEILAVVRDFETRGAHVEWE